MSTVTKDWTPKRWLEASDVYFDGAAGERLIICAFYCLARAVVGMIFLKYMEWSE